MAFSFLQFVTPIAQQAWLDDDYQPELNISLNQIVITFQVINPHFYLYWLQIQLLFYPHLISLTFYCNIPQFFTSIKRKFTIAFGL